ncbi:MAG: lactonase family protein [Bacteroidia bacterium]|nr:MAG: lactonase family protein [Bacteroidia bacterium]
MKMKNFTIKSGIMFLSALTLFSCSGQSQSSESLKFYVGSSGQQEHSIFLCELDTEMKTFAILDSFSGAAGASYLAASPDFGHIYAINQESSDPEQKYSSVTSFAVDSENFGLKFINSQSSMGRGICHIHSSQDGAYIFAANYSSGHASALPVSEEGKILTATSVVIGEGGGPVENRQSGPHAHQVMLDPSQNFLLVPDLGTDKVMIYAFDPSSGQLSPNPVQPFLSLTPGSGPRHLAFHPEGNYLFVVNELNSTLTACRWDSSEGRLLEINTENTVEDGHEGMKYPAAVRVHPNGKFVYASTRGENSCISVFSIAEDGSITRIQVKEQVPFWPRDFNLDPSGRYLISAGERSNDIRLYTIDQDSGLLSETDASLELPAPCCILYIQ